VSKAVLAIDQGTTGTRAYLFDRKARVLGSAYQEFTQHFPHPGLVEHDALEIWDSVRSTIRKALRAASLRPSDLSAIGITNQRETTLLWKRSNSRPVHRAIVWQDRRTSARCEALRKAGKADEIQSRSGLLPDPYFSATKLEWLLRNLKGAGRAAERGELAFGTVDSWLLWKLTGGASHATDATNASRTLLYNLHSLDWDPWLLGLFGVPESVLPRVMAPSSIFGVTHAGSPLGAGIPIAGMAGDQQAALFGQGCVTAGSLKNTYGTGCFLLLHTGNKARFSKRGMLTTVVCAPDGKPAYGMEGAVFIAGAAVQWLRDGLGLLAKASDSEKLAASVPDSGGVYLVPAFTGLGAPHWDPDARGAILGLTRGSGRAQVARAALESMAYQSLDLVEAMSQDAGIEVRELRVDGGACRNNLLMQFQADMLGARVNRPKMVETTALGAAFLAGLRVGFWKSPVELARLRATDRIFRPRMPEKKRLALQAGWKAAVKRVLTR
jgi:glycerol kinase